ncbi:MAG: right-handed parallel beta-helix repeat-containing protein [Planctomycetota bacterium]
MRNSIINCVPLYGGFAGWETQVSQRDLALHKTILSGDLNGDDGPNFTNTGDNSYHVVTGSNTNASAVLDGLVITAGNGGYGGGMLIDSGSPTVRNCAFLGNQSGLGGGMFINYGSGPTLANCLFSGNQSTGDGGGISVFSANVKLLNCTFSANHADYIGGGVEGSAGGSDTANLLLTNCALWGNTAGDGSQIGSFLGGPTTIAVSHSDIQGGQPGVYMGGGTLIWGSDNIVSNPDFVDAAGLDNVAGTLDDNLRLLGSSPCIDAGNNAAVTADIDLDGHARIVDGDGDCYPVVDMGAYEHPEPVFTEAKPPDQGTLWRTAKNCVRLTFDSNISAPGAGQVWIQELLAGGAFGGDLSGGFSFTVENDGGGNPRVVRIRDNDATLAHRKWYGIRNLGGWCGAAPFEVQYVTLRGDVNNDGFVKNADASAIYPHVSPQQVPDCCAWEYDPGDPADRGRFDVNGDCYVKNADASAVYPYVSPLPKPPKPSGHDGGGGDGFAGGEGAPEAPASDSWSDEAAALTFEVRPLGGGAPLTVLAPHTIYELHYQSSCTEMNSYVLFAVATSREQGLAKAAPPPAGAWSSTGHFEFFDVEGLSGQPVPAYGYPEGYWRTHLAHDYLGPDTDRYAGGQGHLCNFTTASTGELNLDLYMEWSDPDTLELVTMRAQAAFAVEDAAEDTVE